MSTFVDLHAHPPVAELLEGPLSPHLPGLATQLGHELTALTPDEIANRYRSADGRVVLLGWDSESIDHIRPFSTADVASVVREAPDVYWGFGAVDPAKGALAVAQVHEAARLGMKGLALHPAAQRISPAGKMTAPVWEAAQDHDLICLFETGLSRLGAGVAGGGGVLLEAAHPIHIDGIAARFPRLRIVIAHTGDLWRDEALAVALHKRNVWLCPSGAGPGSWPELGPATSGPLGDRLVVGSGYPFGDPETIVKLWRGVGLDDETEARVMRDNALDLLSPA